jgi:hypothetical protein
MLNMTDVLVQTCRTAMLAIVVIGPPIERAVAHQDQSPKPAADVGRTVTLRGCLQSWDGTPTGIGRSGTASGVPTQYVLTDVEAAPSPAAEVPAPAGATSPPTGAPAVAHNTYVVEAGSPAVTLAAHLDREVEVTGMLAVIPPHDASARDPKRGDETGRPGAPPSAGQPPVGTSGTAGVTQTTPVTIQRLTAKEVKVVAQSCGK